MYADVLVELKVKKIDQTFTYIIPNELKEKIFVGMRVLVPFGKQKLEGFVLNIHEENNSNYQMKKIISITDEKPVLNDELLKLGEYISKKTLSLKIQAYQTMLPSALKAKNNFNISKKYEKYLVLKIDYNEALQKIKSDLQKKILYYFKEKNKILKKDLTKISVSAIATLKKYNILEELEEEVYRINNSNIIYSNDIILTEEQEAVKNKVLNQKNFKPFLLHGVTGSGKTEVYISIISELIKKDKTALVLVPEISLTPQFVSKFQKRFGNKIALLHSMLSDGERYDEWRKIENKEASIVIGARSAIFAPLENIGIIIIDEEHSSTYKQENTPKYNTIDVALFRGKYHNCPVLLGSATPTIESYTRAKVGVYELLELKNRISNKMPKVEIVSMRDEIKKGNNLFSEKLLNKINEKLSKKEQIIILLNKRGYARVLTCHDCGYTDKCPHCDIPLTYHKSSNTMRCHYCGYGKGVTKKCPECNSENISTFGIGTQKIEESLNELFPNNNILRMDADTTTRKNSYEKMINDFKNQKYDILVGTQMIAKGLDFDNVTLVGVIDADSSLNVPDFRSSERTFDLLNQVAGRAGRSNKEGEVIFQCFNDDHYSIIMASEHNYKEFYEKEISLRKLMGYPPYYNLALIVIKSKNESLALKESEKISNFLKNKTKAKVLGPAPSAIPKINDFYLYKVILKYKKKEDIIKALTYINSKYVDNKVLVDIDINPLNI